MSTTHLYVVVISRIHGIESDQKVSINKRLGDSSKHLLMRLLPEMAWMPAVAKEIDVTHSGTTPPDADVKKALEAAMHVATAIPPAPSEFTLGDNIFAVPGTVGSKWADGRWVETLTASGGASGDYVAAFQVLYGGEAYWQAVPAVSSTSSSSVLLRIDYLVIAQQASITD